MRIAKVGDIYSIWNEAFDKWALLQVIEETDKKIAILDLEGVFDALPLAEELGNLKPLIVNHHNWSGDYSCRYIDTKKVPERIKFITNSPPIIELKVNSYSIGWPKGLLQSFLQYQWDLLDKKITSDYKKAKKSKATVLIGEREVSLSSDSIYLKETDEIAIHELKKLPTLTEIRYTGESKELISFVESSPLVSKLEWIQHQQETLDFSNTIIDRLILDVTGLQQLTLNKEIRVLSISGDLTNLQTLKIEHPLEGKFLEINWYTTLDIEIPDFKLPHLSELSLHVNRIDFDFIAQKYPNIKALRIWGNPGYVEGFKSLSKLKKIETIQLNDLFGFKLSDIPNREDLSKLEFLWLTSIPKEVGQFIKKHFKDVSNIRITKLRNEKWLAENLNNPFRSWDGREGMSASNAKKAFNAFKKLNAAVDKKQAETDLTAAFLSFVAVFNKIDEETNSIATMEREEIYEVYMELADKITEKKELLFDLFEEHRDF